MSELGKICLKIVDEKKLTNEKNIKEKGKYAIDAYQLNADEEGTIANEMKILKKSVSDGKSKVAEAITSKGQNTDNSASFDTMATNIRRIDTVQQATQDATATSADILSGKTSYSKGNKITGTMANQGAKTASLNCGGSYNIPAGYHNGSGTITANNLASQTSASATAGDILSGKTAYVNGTKVTGNIVDRAYGEAWGEDFSSPPTYDPNSYYAIQRIPEGYYHACNGWFWSPEARVSQAKVHAALGISADKIMSGQKVGGLYGTATEDATATSDDIAEGKTAYVNGRKLVGRASLFDKVIYGP